MSVNSYNPNNLPAWLVKACQKEAEAEKSLKNPPVVKIKPSKEWLSTAQYAERCHISLSAAKNRLARAFSSDYYQLPKLKNSGLSSFDQDYVRSSNSSLVVRCVPNSTGGKKYEVRSDSLPENHQEISSNDPTAFLSDIPSVLTSGNLSIFCDWVTMSQRHNEFASDFDPAGNVVSLRQNPIKDLNGGKFIVLNNSGNTEQIFYQEDGQSLTKYILAANKEDLQTVVDKYFQCEGSWDSRIFVRCVNGRVDLHGNIGKFGRPDNLFGYSLEDCIKSANKLLVDLGLPPFTVGRYDPHFKMVGKKNPEEVFVNGWTGVTFSRIDLTANLSFGKAEDVAIYLNWLSSQHISRMRNYTHPDGNTVEIGLSESGGKSKYIQMIAYNKLVEFKTHSGKQLKKIEKKVFKGKSDLDIGFLTDYYDQLTQYMAEMGVARLELRLKRDYLHQHDDVRFLGNLQKNFSQLNDIFIERWSAATRDFEMKPINDMSKQEKEVYSLYIAGVDLSVHYKRATFYRKRNLLLNFGIDISEPFRGETTVPQLSTMRSIQVRPLAVPSFYYLPEVVNG